VENQKTKEVPIALKDSHYQGAKRLGHGEGYKYAHDYADHYVEQEYMPGKAQYYQPTELGFEKIIKERMEKLRKNGPQAS
jgi:putative ATPase